MPNLKDTANSLLADWHVSRSATGHLRLLHREALYISWLRGTCWKTASTTVLQCFPPCYAEFLKGPNILSAGPNMYLPHTRAQESTGWESEIGRNSGNPWEEGLHLNRPVLKQVSKLSFFLKHTESPCNTWEKSPYQIQGYKTATGSSNKSLKDKTLRKTIISSSGILQKLSISHTVWRVLKIKSTQITTIQTQKSALLFSVLAGIKSKNWQKLRRLEKKLGFALLAKFGNRIKQIASF